MKYKKIRLFQILANVFYGCAFEDLKQEQQITIIKFCEDNVELLCAVWKKGHRIWRKDRNNAKTEK